MEKYWTFCPVDHRHIAMINGCAPAMEFMMQILCEEYDTIIAPTPTFSSFFSEWWCRARVSIVGAHTKAEDKFDITTECLEDAYERSLKKGKAPKMLVLIQPNNPTGKLYSRETLMRCIKWAFEKGIHVVSDEIYAITIFEGNTMLSAAQVVYEELEKVEKSSAEDDKKFAHYLKNYVHVVGGFSKDFSLNGLRSGLIYTQNEEVLDALNGMIVGAHNYMSNNTAFYI